MSRKGKTRKKEPFIDDGRTIANMNVDGMPWYIDEAKRKQETVSDSGEPLELTKKERRAAMGGILAAVLLIGLVFAVCFLVFILFCVFVWFR